MRLIVTASASLMLLAVGMAKAREDSPTAAKQDAKDAIDQANSAGSMDMHSESNGSSHAESSSESSG